MDKVLRVGYAVYPSVKMRDITPDPSTKSGVKMKFVKELLFGDYIKPYVTDGAYETITVKSGTNKGEYIKVHCRNVDGYIKKSEIQEKRILEVNFIDVGQGDGCHIATPDDKHILIDAGKGKNMYRYLRTLTTTKVLEAYSPRPREAPSSSPSKRYITTECWRA